MSAPTRSEIREAILIDGLPPDSRQLLDLDNPASNVWKEADAIAGALKTHAFDLEAQFRTETNPATATSTAGGLLPDWENALGLASTKTAAYGSDEARQAQVVSRLREFGASTRPNIQAALAKVCGYVPTILEHSRAALTAANTHTNATGISIAGGGTVSQTVTFGDNAAASTMGAQLIFANLTASDLTDLIITLTGPDATAVSWTPSASKTVFSSINSADPLTFFATGFAGAACSGTWTLTVTSAAGDVACDSWAVFVEGIGRDPTSYADGLGANVFEWAARIDPALIDPATYDVTVARTIVTRWNPAHCRGYLVQKNQNGGNNAVYDDTNTPFDGGTFA